MVAILPACSGRQATTIALSIILQGITAEKPFKGSFTVRVSPKLHRKAALLAMENKMSLNNFITESIRERINKVTENRQ